jgi:hypothetical protein
MSFGKQNFAKIFKLKVPFWAIAKTLSKFWKNSKYIKKN